MCIICSLLWSSAFCYFANLVTDRVSMLSDSVYDLNWFDQPMEMQKYIILMMARSQERVYFSGFGLISCSMEIFGKVCSISWMTFIIIAFVSGNHWSNILNLFYFPTAAPKIGNFILFDFQAPNAALRLMGEMRDTFNTRLAWTNSSTITSPNLFIWRKSMCRSYNFLWMFAVLFCLACVLSC